LTFGEGVHADVRVSETRLDDLGRAVFDLTYEGRSRSIALNLFGEHQAMNAAAAAAIAVGLGLSFDAVCDALGTAQPRSRWRMEVAETPQGFTVINDAYNANPDSMRAALKTLVDMGHRRPGARTIAVLGEMAELGDTARDEHDGIGRLVVRLDVDQLVVVGETARALHLGASLEGSWDGESVLVTNADDAVALVRGVVRPGDVVLVKASRSAGLEKVAAALLADGGDL
jgi:UDP-N-acetylmuramoyl-tripeptide--D-alanyl-D-alanine ligase